MANGEENNNNNAHKKNTQSSMFSLPDVQLSPE